MKKVSFVQETGYSASGSTSVVTWHETGKNHNFTAYKLLGNVDVASALDEARQREIQAHNAPRLSQMMKHHINAAVYLSAQGLPFGEMTSQSFHQTEGIFLNSWSFLGVTAMI